MILLDNLKQIFTKSLPNWIDKASLSLSWLSSALSELVTIESDFLTEADYTTPDAKKAKSNWLCNQSIYIGAENIPTFESKSFVSRLIDRGTVNGFIELSYYLDGENGSYSASEPTYTWAETDTSWTFTSQNVEVTVYKTTLSKTVTDADGIEDTVGVMSDNFWIADQTSPGDATITLDSTGKPIYVGPSLSHATIRILQDRTQQSVEDNREFIRKHFIPAGLPVIFL